jgi:polyisoprenoid-binding protein YceI
MSALFLEKNKIQKAVAFFCFLMLFQFVQGQIHPVPGESSVRFTIHNFGFKTGGSLSAPEGEIYFSPEDLGKSSFHVEIKTESINTDNESRDEHLKEEEYFDVKNYPLIRFVSSSIRTSGKDGEYVAVGLLTIKKTSREIEIPFSAEKKGGGWLFTGSFKMNRRDYGVGGSSTLSNELTVDIIVNAR